MKRLYILLSTGLLLLGGLHAQPTAHQLEWVEACEGSSVEVITDQGEIISVTADAEHHAISRHWKILFVKSIPVTAEYREYRKNRAESGEAAGQVTGCTLTKAMVWQAKEGKFEISDEALSKELQDLLAKSREPKLGNQ